MDDPRDGYWWCPNCSEEATSSGFTVEKIHQCGHRVEYIALITTSAFGALRDERKKLQARVKELDLKRGKLVERAKAAELDSKICLREIDRLGDRVEELEKILEEAKDYLRIGWTDESELRIRINKLLYRPVAEDKEKK